jgi:hypothetical protein
LIHVTKALIVIFGLMDGLKLSEEDKKDYSNRLKLN